MTNIVKNLTDKGLIQPPPWLPMNTAMLGITGSISYGVSSDSSDVDLCGFTIPPRTIIFPHLDGYIQGFGTPPPSFNQYQKHHILDPSALGGKGQEYDITVFNIVKYFQLCMENNPNCIDYLFIPQTCIMHMTSVGNMVREKRKLFLHKGCFKKFKGYAYSQLHKMQSKNPQGKRKKLIEQHGFDTKFAFHVIRLLSQVEQILIEGDLDLQEVGRREHMKAIRRGEVSEEEIRKWASEKELQLEKLYAESKLPERPPEEPLRQLLLHCLEEHYGSLSDAVTDLGWAERALRDIDLVLNETRNKLYS